MRGIDSNPSVPQFARAPFLPGAGERRAHVRERDGVAVVPLASAADTATPGDIVTRSQVKIERSEREKRG